MEAFQLIIDIAGACALASAVMRFVLWIDTPRRTESRRTEKN